MRHTFRYTLASVAASAALLAGAVVAPVAQADPAAPTGEALAAKQALDAIGPTDAAAVTDSIAAANTLLKQLKITPFTPTLGACTDFTLAPAVGGALAGPNTPLLGDLTIPGMLGLPDIDINAVKKGEILYGFVPVGTFNDSRDKTGMRVAWFNVNTFQGSIGDPMDGFAETITAAVVKRIKESKVPLPGTTAEATAKTVLAPVLDLLPSNGVRGGLVKTEAGTVLSAIYGTVKKGDATCYFFPSLGVATVK